MGKIDDFKRNDSYLIQHDIQRQISFWKCMQIAACGIVSYFTACKEMISVKDLPAGGTSEGYEYILLKN